MDGVRPHTFLPGEPFDQYAEEDSRQAREGNLYRNGRIVKQPAPTADPRDPLNLSLTRKIVAVVSICFYGALAAAAELILGSLLPVFVLQYAGQNPSKVLITLSHSGGLPKGVDPLRSLQLLSKANGGPPLWKIYLLASLPVLMMGVCNLIFIPLAVAVGRRPVILGCGVLAIGGAVWAGFSQSLSSHLGARCVQALGAGTVESLIPFIIQDMVFVHQRNTWISSIFAVQGIIIVVLGAATPYLIVRTSWRWAYWVTASGAGFFLLCVALTLPETRWTRSSAEMNGVPRRDNGESYPRRTWRYDLALFHGQSSFRRGWDALLDILRTFFYPQILFITLLNSVMIGAMLAAGYTLSPALISAPWSWNFLHLGLALIPILIAALCVGALTGRVADMVANFAAKRRGRRVPENQLINLILPTLCGITGTVLFGLAGSHRQVYPWSVFLVGMGLMAFGFLGTNTVGAVYVLEVYPQLAGPALANIASFRCLIAFVLSFRISEWMLQMGYLNSMMIYTGLMAAFAAFVPVIYVFGPRWRERWPGNRKGGF
ncbi:major facilitator superfamily transporter [Piedraia hortae CBS 480.64]|uniref:Major facilitator superfamily transporter n=1 Tax=Piedraia hortae CBS 480.64 TaxID=1314780 RepID=A0A6A7C123_9PEZI|nr:major facilitator superfamily transporter [Piedraia hortae CBS 480.64]